MAISIADRIPLATEAVRHPTRRTSRREDVFNSALDRYMAGYAEFQDRRPKAVPLGSDTHWLRTLIRVLRARA